MDHAHHAVSALVHRYAELIDAGDLDGLADLLAHAELTAEGDPGVVRGRQAVLDRYRTWTRIHQDGTPRTLHLVTNLVVEASPGRGVASARSTFTVLQEVPGELALQPVVAGRYADRFERVGGVWRFAARHITPRLVGDLRAHLRHTLPDQP